MTRSTPKSRSTSTPPEKRTGRKQSSEHQENDRKAASSLRKQPTVRKANIKIPRSVARLLQAGHPWIFRNSLQRVLPDLALGSLVSIVDHGGYSIGWGLFETEGAIAVRMLSCSEEFAWTEQEMQSRLQRALALRVSTPVPQEATRLVHSESDGFPGLTIDRWGKFLLFTKYSRVADPYVQTLISIGEQALAPEGIYMQDRTRPIAAEERRPPATLITGRAAPTEFEIEEDGLKFIVDISAPSSPGLFFDLREGRRMCEAWVEGRSVLNLFSHTGGFSLRAVRGKAKTVTNVDALARNHARCRQNLAASGFDPETCEALTGDVLKHLERFRQQQRSFDFVIVDPPSASHAQSEVVPSAFQEWKDLAVAIAPVVQAGGFLLAVFNTLRLSEEECLLAIGEGMRSLDRTILLVGECGLPPDFPVLPAFGEGRYLKIKLFQLP